MVRRVFMQVMEQDSVCWAFSRMDREISSLQGTNFSWNTTNSSSWKYFSWKRHKKIRATEGGKVIKM